MKGSIYTGLKINTRRIGRKRRTCTSTANRWVYLILMLGYLIIETIVTRKQENMKVETLLFTICVAVRRRNGDYYEKNIILYYVIRCFNVIASE